MSYREEFPNYPVAAMPLIPQAFEDESWHNDACPSFASESLGMKLYVDYLDPGDREYGTDLPRFALYRVVDETELPGEQELVLVVATDDWLLVLEQMLHRGYLLYSQGKLPVPDFVRLGNEIAQSQIGVT